MNRILDLTGVFAFATSGALLAARKRLDVVGMAVLAMITALGGGIVRDLSIGSVPPAAFRDMWYVLLPLAATVLVFFWHQALERLTPAVLIFDAAGLGFFCVAGAAKALAFGLAPFAAVLLGGITAIGGGIARDVLAGEVPSVLRYDREMYAVPALVGAAMVVALDFFAAYGPASALGAVALAFLLRLLALRYDWRAPRARRMG